MALALRNLKDLSAGSDDLQRQFTNTVDTNKAIVFMKHELPTIQNNAYLNNLKEFEKMLKETMLDKNIETAIRTFTSSIIMLSELRKIGVRKWRRKFAGTSFKYFKNKKELNKFKESVIDRIDKYFKEIIDKEIENFEKQHEERKRTSNSKKEKR